MKIVATTVQTARTQKIQVEKIKHDGTQVEFFVGSFRDHTDFAKCSKRLGVSEADIKSVVNANRSTGQPAELLLTGGMKPKSRFRVRTETGSASWAALVDEFDDALQKAKLKPDTVIEWENTDHVCCLDIDFPSWYKPDNAELLAFCQTLKPQPVYYWLSRNRGLHLIYYAKEFYTAAELASVGGYHFNRFYPNGMLEFLHRTRRPSGEVFTGRGDTDIDILKTMLLEYRDTDCSAWLTEHGYNLDGGKLVRYPHTKCPVNPSVRAKSNTDPVVVYPDHIFCYICQKDGKCCGSRRAGYFPIAALSGGRINTQIATCVNNFVHWSHAKHVVTGQVVNHNHARQLYGSLLKLKHGDDIRIPLVFTAGEPNGLIRYEGYWCDYLGSIVELPPTSPILRQLPHCHDLQPNGGTELNPATCEWLSKPVDLASRGYYAVTPLRGIHITQWQELPSNKIYNVLQTPELSPEDMAKRRPEYITKELRNPDAWNVLETIFPKIDRNLIELLIAGRGCMEHRAGLPPMLAITGPTEVGKTSHIRIAAAICGDSTSNVTLKRDRDRFMNGVMKAKLNSGFVMFDEFFKYAKQAQLSNVEAMEELLSFTESTLIYMVHTGSIMLGNLPFFIWCDNKIPTDVESHEQIGRRVFYHNLPSRVSWEKPLSDAGIRKPEHIRLYGDDDVILACNSILSDVIERFFTTPVTDFAEVARELGFKNLRNSEAVEDKKQLIRDLFDAVCNAPDITDANDKKRFSPPGYKVFNLAGNDRLLTAFDLCQKETEKKSLDCAIIAEADLQNDIGLKCPAKMELKSHGMKRAIRFVSIDGSLTNSELR